MNGLVLSKELVDINGIDYYISKKLKLLIYTMFNKNDSNHNLSEKILKEIENLDKQTIFLITDDVDRCKDF